MLFMLAALWQVDRHADEFLCLHNDGVRMDIGG